MWFSRDDGPLCPQQLVCGKPRPQIPRAPAHTQNPRFSIPLLIENPLEECDPPSSRLPGGLVVSTRRYSCIQARARVGILLQMLGRDVGKKRLPRAGFLPSPRKAPAPNRRNPQNAHNYANCFPSGPVTVTPSNRHPMWTPVYSSQNSLRKVWKSHAVFYIRFCQNYPCRRRLDYLSPPGQDYNGYRYQWFTSSTLPPVFGIRPVLGGTGANVTGA